LNANGTPYKDNLRSPTLYANDSFQFTQVAVGKDHIAAITSEGKLYTMGTVNHGKLGHTPKELTPEEKEKERLEYKKRGYTPGNASRSKPMADFVGGYLANVKVRSVACGEHHTVAVTENGEVYSWGRGRFGALGHESQEDLALPKKVEGLTDIVRVDCGSDYTIALDKNGKLYSFGDNSYG
jgi:E3 ubiquitin-protein ligase HERC2